MRGPPRPEWQRDAACRATGTEVQVRMRVEVMVGSQRSNGIYGTTPAVAKRFCQRCPVVAECLDEAMANPALLGVWGGLTERERNDRRNRKRTAA